MDVKAKKKALEKRESELQQLLITALDGNTDGLTESFKISWLE